ncbi:uncharacterized protein BT62DRAFT_480230 [Guyanagaster necrorhizus]|uniref:Uncharacterized protein n=1 Tax=Guyanagaster necrorhizus TaxID=856835 RepID=A0A9P7VJ28_9AGAR|nr:uncharacterized protein BT62DRAFT_480230 [Guyanagaster necrorhizus MCA 3950]KAG7441488.1 hypothetical protein BT62DRAFT_480230 [Guyanagaster necrorhizus MCA 3950]
MEAPLTDLLFENLVDLLSRVIDGLSEVPPIILSNLLRSPGNLDLPIVKLMGYLTYKAFRARIAAPSLVPQVLELQPGTAIYLLLRPFCRHKNQQTPR